VVLVLMRRLASIPWSHVIITGGVRAATP
jgi:hypothetical protein